MENNNYIIKAEPIWSLQGKATKMSFHTLIKSQVYH